MSPPPHSLDAEPPSDVAIRDAAPLRIVFGRMVRAAWRARGGKRGGPAQATRLLVRLVRHRRRLHRWFDGSRPVLLRALGGRRTLCGVVDHPYISTGWDREQRLDVIETHYALVADGPWPALREVAATAGARRVLARIDVGGHATDVVLDAANFVALEGELALHLYHRGTRIYTVAFTLGIDAGARVAWLGGLQGAEGGGSVPLYRDLTHAYHGLRPRDLLLTSLQSLCRALGVERIVAIGDAHHTCRAAYYEERAQVHTSYDAVWQELGAHARDDGFHEFASTPHRRAAHEIPSRKRALYQRRYAMLDRLDADLGAAILPPDAATRGSLPAIRPGSSMFIRTLAALRGSGVKSRLLHPHDEWWDRRLGIHTFGFRPAVGDPGEPQWQGHYQATSYRDLFRMLEHVGLGADDVYVDLGCGLGRTVFAAASRGARRAVGVDIDGPFIAACERSRDETRLDGHDIRFLCLPAQEYPHDGTTVLFLFHPFGRGTLAEVLEQVRATAVAAGSRFRLVYFNAIADDVLEQCGFLRRTARWEPGRDWQPTSGPYPASFWSAG